MKKRSLILAVVFLIAASASFQPLCAQEKSKEQKEKEIQEAINAQKKAMAEQKKAEEELQKALEEQQKTMEEAMKSYRVLWDDTSRFNRAFRIYEDMGRSRSYRPVEPFIVTPGIDFFNHYNGDAERTSWEFSKNMKESSFSREYVFDVEENAKTVVMSLNGDCRDGEINIKIIMPSGKTYSEMLIDDSGNLNWRKSITITETENKDKIGAWKFVINSSKASGYFRISLQTY